MTPPIWSDVSADLAIAAEETRRAREKAATLPDHPAAVRESIELAIGKHLHDAYSAAESAIERLVRTVDGEVPGGPRHRRDLLDRAARPIERLRPVMIREETRRLLARLVGFRHAFRHAYGTFRWTDAEPNIALVAEAVPLLAADLVAFSTAMGYRPP